MRRPAKCVAIGNTVIGGDAPVLIQSMLKCPPADIEGNIRQALALQMAGCDIIRIAIPDKDAIRLISAMKESVSMPVVADIHFDWRLALESVAAGADKVRINPGNIGSDDRVKAVAAACREKNVPIRIGVNAGSVEKHILSKHGGPSAPAMAESALYHAGLLERLDFSDIVLSIKSSDAGETIRANRILAEECGYPLHLGLTHTGTPALGLIASAVGIGSLLAEGIGDTIRVSLTDTPEAEIQAAKDILKVTGRGSPGVNIISCPTCGRCTNDIVRITNLVSDALKSCNLPITVAVMGCSVNGPGEAREADVALVGSRDYCALYKKGKLVGKVNEDETIPALLALVEDLQQLQED